MICLSAGGGHGLFEVLSVPRSIISLLPNTHGNLASILKLKRPSLTPMFHIRRLHQIIALMNNVMNGRCGVFTLAG